MTASSSKASAGSSAAPPRGLLDLTPSPSRGEEIRSSRFRSPHYHNRLIVHRLLRTGPQGSRVADGGDELRGRGAAVGLQALRHALHAELLIFPVHRLKNAVADDRQQP